MVDDLIRLLLRPVRLVDDQAGPERFDACREDTGAHVVRSSQPLYDGARALLDGGELPTRRMTTRHVGRLYDNYRPAPIGTLAGYGCFEDRRGVRRTTHKSPPWRR